MMRAATVRRLDRLHERLGASYLIAVLAIVVVATALFAAFDVTVLQLYRDVGTADFALLFALGESVNALGLLIGTLLFAARPLLRLARWMHAGEPSAQAREMLELVSDFPRRAVPPIAATIMLVEIPAIEYFRAHAEGDVSIVVVLLAILAPNGAAGFFVYLILEQLLRPVARAAATRSGALAPPPRAGISLRTKLLIGLPSVNFMTAYAAVGHASHASTVAARLTLGVLAALAVTLTISMVLTVTLTRSFSEPVRELTDATDRVERGDLSTGVAPLVDDELGVLAGRFNEMVVGLRERESFRSRNVELLEEVRASRARIVEASDAERRRVERNIHDGAQQQLVALAVKLKLLEEDVADDERARAKVVEIEDRLKGALGELRELARGLHPTVLTTDGLPLALDQLAARAPLPVSVSAPSERFPETVESTAYFVACEALANVAKYAQATQAQITVEQRNGQLTVEVSDDGVGGAHASPGSGLAGLLDRVAALDGTIAIDSPAGAGTKVTAELPL